MTSLVATESITGVDDTNSLVKIESDTHYYKNRQRRHVLRSKENTYKHKCNKVLRRKLKQYKLRQDGWEDQDVLDVTNIFVSSLIIKSPKTKPSECECDFEDIRPRNYLFKMVRRKEDIKISESTKNSEVNIQNGNIDKPLAISSPEKKETNAFKLLMDSRNKSIGSNSPGKEKSNENLNTEEELDRKNRKAKRQLQLQKMAEGKGSLKNKEKEEYQELIINRQMEKRAERLKLLILKDSKIVKENDASNNTVLKKVDVQKFVSKDKAVATNNNNLKKHVNKFEIIDMFDTVEDPINISPEKKITTEDQEFLNKLSPSLKKKENMLCYFKKIDKESECSVNSENCNFIKVKLKPRNKKRIKKKKLSLRRETVDLMEKGENITNDECTTKYNQEPDEPVENLNTFCIEDENQDEINQKQYQIDKKLEKINSVSSNENALKKTEVKSGRQKWKRDFNVGSKSIDPNHNENRPKRSVKRPIKYIDDVCLSSSDEELHIFTPKKKKHTENLAINETMKPKSVKKVVIEEVSKKPTKLAPIFSTPKQHDPAALEAKKKFLQSGVPDKLKKIIHQKKYSTSPDQSFTVVVHVQQRETSRGGNEVLINIPLINATGEDICSLIYEKDAFKKLLHLNEPVHTHNINANYKKSTQSMLQNLKKSHPKFPVYRTYRYLKDKGRGEFKDCTHIDVDDSIEIMNDVLDDVNESPDKLNWTDKYKATSTNHIIGNFESIKELKKWLITWTENELKLKSKTKVDSDSSDYYQSDTDSRDSMKTMNNLLILTGPTGCGKTASVYAVAADLAMKVIEVNASSKRTGKIILQDLQEATQSHKVNRGKGNIDNSQKSQGKDQPDISKKIKKRGRPKKYISDDKTTEKISRKPEIINSASLSQESTRTDSSLILIDDADIVFDQDDGFSSAIVQLVQCSKRPFIIITSSLVCPHLQRFLQTGKILKMSPLIPRMLGTWLDIMCLADTGICSPGVGAKFLNYFKGDIRKTINYLQFYISSSMQVEVSDEETASQNIDLYKTNIDEESSCMSWADNDDSETRTIATVVDYKMDSETTTIWSDFGDKHLNLLEYTYPLQLFNIWWSMSSLLPIKPYIGNTGDKSKDKPQRKEEYSSHKLEAISNAIDALSLSDFISHINPDSNTYITSQPWTQCEGHSVSELESFDYYYKEYEVIDEICHTMVTGSIKNAQNLLGSDRKTDIILPGMTLERERDRVVSQYKSLTSYLNPSAVLDRRALSLDYWSSCRTICRLEKSKNDSNMKRNNRFCHYLKSLSVLCKSDTFDNLCGSLCSNGGTELNISNFNE